MELLEYTIDASNDRGDPNILKKWRSNDGLNEYLEEKGLIIQKKGDWIVTMKSGPYSDKDIMIIYSGKKSNIANIKDIDTANLNILQKFLEDISEGIEENLKQELQNGEIELITGVNSSLMPGRGRTQSVFRPHFHITVLNSKEGTRNNIETKKISFNENHKRKLAANDENLKHINNFKQFLGDEYQYSNSYEVGKDYYAIDIQLNQEDNILGNKNFELYKEINQKTYTFLQKQFEEILPSQDLQKTIFRNHKRILEILNDSSSDGIFSREDWEKSFLRDICSYETFLHFSQLGFTTIFFKKEGKKYLRIKFTHKNLGEEGGMMETYQKIINRINKKDPLLPDMTECRNLIEKILFSQ